MKYHISQFVWLWFSLKKSDEVTLNKSACINSSLNHIIKQLLLLFYQYIDLVVLEVQYSPHLQLGEYCTSRITN